VGKFNRNLGIDIILFSMHSTRKAMGAVEVVQGCE
jgi:hypothetical protein